MLDAIEPLLDSFHASFERIEPGPGLVAECAKFGFSVAIVPAGTAARGKLNVLEQKTLGDAMKAGLDAGQSG